MAQRTDNNQANTVVESLPEGAELVGHSVTVEQKKPISKRGRIILAILLAILIILLLLACGLLTNFLQPKRNYDAPTEGVTWIRSVYAYGPDASQLISPASCAVDPDGSGFWVADQDSFRLVEFNWNGTFKSLFEKDASGNIAFNFPSDIAVARNGWIYVAQQTYNNVLIYDNNHNQIANLEVFQPMSVAVNDDMLLVGARNGFVAFSPTGDLIGYVGDWGHGEDQFDTINGVALDEESNAYIVDTYNNRLSKYDAAGDKVWMVQLGVAGNEGTDQRGLTPDEIAKTYPSAMQQPMGITIDNAGRLIIIDGLDFTIAAFDPKDGTFLAKYGTYGSEDGQLAYSSDISYDKQRDWFVLTDSGNFRAQIIKLPGSGGGLLADLNAQLTSPLGACCVPILLIILCAILYLVWRFLRKRREKKQMERDKAIALEHAESVLSGGSDQEEGALSNGSDDRAGEAEAAEGE
ncbi:MAG: NHL repeat-containing protein [Actinomycetes bacterium]|jgi:DNA-binding beta-propeller fold protein YncE|nr:NHL repeat-containing protein [Actinomycetes bacterium]